jgi:hypothetical protein
VPRVSLSSLTLFRPALDSFAARDEIASVGRGTSTVRHDAANARPLEPVRGAATWNRHRLGRGRTGRPCPPA